MTKRDWSADELRAAKEATVWVKAHTQEIIDRIIGDTPRVDGSAVSILMAGSPGAGKTEFSRHFVKALEERGYHTVRIDPDAIREMIPQYVPGKAELFQLAVSIAVEKVHHAALSRAVHFLLDGTSANREKLENNINRSLKRGRGVILTYVYQDPMVAWELTQQREIVEGRNIPKDIFIRQFFAAYENVHYVQEKFEKSVEIQVIRRNTETGAYDAWFDVKIAQVVNFEYTEDTLRKRL